MCTDADESSWRMARQNILAAWSGIVDRGAFVFFRATTTSSESDSFSGTVVWRSAPSDASGVADTLQADQTSSLWEVYPGAIDAKRILPVLGLTGRIADE